MDEKLKPEKQSWSKPTLRKYELTEEELAEIRESDDPMAKLKTVKPELFDKSGRD